MKKIYLFILSCLLLCSISCNKYLDVVPDEYITDKDVFENINLAEQALARLYNALPNDAIQEATSYTDESYHHWFDNENGINAYKYNLGTWSTTDNPFGNWAGRYQDIRRANVFIERIESVPIPLNRAAYYEIWKPRYKAEARFIRALFYFEQFRRFGAVPLLTGAADIDLNDLASNNIERNSTDEIIDFIVAECDAIAKDLPETQEGPQLGRVTKGAALALKARTLVYAASPLFNGNAMYANVVNKDGKHLFNTAFDKEKWKKAADAAMDVINMPIYKLYAPFPDNPIQNYAAQFYVRDYTESIFMRITPNGTSVDAAFLPNGPPFKGKGRYTPLQEFVDAYEMANGYPINEPGSGYTAAGTYNGPLWDGLKLQNVTNISNMYKNRDPRFYATIFFQNDVWRFDVTKRGMKFAYFGSGNGKTDGWANGKGGTNPMGYNVRKYCTPDYDANTGTGTGKRNYQIYRLAEMYLIYAEAMNEYQDAPDNRVFEYINKVRARVKMPALPILAADNSKEGMRKRIQNENRIEFAYENHRFWDVRRWMIAKTVDNGEMHVLNAKPSTEELLATGITDVNSEAAGLAVFYKQVVIQNRVFLDKHYLMPIPQSEIDKDPYLVQNYGW
ncbi:RagB/SusD family nutrient uptake outer membrane protein [Chitinophaga sp. SYP-B3965]|uniref:RagB/SusD family nutrient uptake outer membrane protein n=1 Tax=Chitinophaga sp. SYP-B3965 TaxID=2663120 RepID=UPI00129954C3|nr:RagB/SusD family nutrient uptake outer membrane protein [Chitinophaga sp. SYP-B3965]MRG48040.1 RagB/SusD family nutrient uptake outer membrane protein [Chitinophaga sp. SYP-B3965]